MGIEAPHSHTAAVGSAADRVNLSHEQDALDVPPGSPEELVERIVEQIGRSNEAVLSLDQLEILCPAKLSVSEEFRCIAELAIANRWSFAFLPGQVVRFTSLR